MGLNTVNHSRDLTVISNTIVKGRYELTKQEQSLIYLLIAQIEKDDEDFKTYKITVSDLDKISQVTHNRKRIKELQLSIMKKPIFITKTKAVNWFSMIESLEKESALLVRFDKDLKPYLLQLKNEFTQAELPTLLSFKSKYTSRLFLLLKSDFDRNHKQKKVFEYGVEWLLQNFEMPETYRARYSKFKEAFLDRCCKEINEKTAFNIEYKVSKKQGKKITHLDFIITEKITHTEPPKHPKETIESLLSAHGITAYKMQWVSTWGLDIGYIRKVIKYIPPNDLDYIINDMLTSSYDKMASKKAVLISKCEAWIKDNYTEQQATINLDDMAQHIEEAIKQGCIQI